MNLLIIYYSNEAVVVEGLVAGKAEFVRITGGTYGWRRWAHFGLKYSLDNKEQYVPPEIIPG